MRNIDWAGIFAWITFAVAIFAIADCSKSEHKENQKTIQLKLQLEHNAKIE